MEGTHVYNNGERGGGQQTKRGQKGVAQKIIKGNTGKTSDKARRGKSERFKGSVWGEGGGDEIRMTNKKTTFKEISREQREGEG